MNIIHTLTQKVQYVVQWLRPMQIPLHSARTGFYVVLSLFPSLLLLLGLLRYTGYGVEALMYFLEGLLPQSLLPLVESLISASYRHSSKTLVSLSALAALWSASKGTYGLLCGLLAVYGAKDPPPYWRMRTVSVGYTLIFLLALLLTLALHVFGSAVLDFLWMTTLPPVLVVMNFIDLRFVLLILLQTALFTLLYALLPGQRNRLRYSIAGALLSSLCWSVFSELFSIYVEHFAGYANIFGSIYALALGMLWLYFCISILFYGGAFNRYLTQRKKKNS